MALLAQQSPSFMSKIKKFNMEFGKELDKYIHFAKQYCVRPYWRAVFLPLIEIENFLMKGSQRLILFKA